MGKVSFIVPIYNTEKYLERCIDSILAQAKANDIEIILVNDGSTDNSYKIAKEYEKEYPEIICYFEKENGGLSDARNYGVELAKGEYLAFVDSDDYLAEDLLEKLTSYIEKKQDIIKFKTIKVIDNKKEEIKGPVFEQMQGEKAFEVLFPNDVMLDAAWLYLYRTEFYKKNHFTFEKGAYHEDFGLTPMVINVAKTVTSTDVYGYFYVQTQGSITRNANYSKTVKRAWDMLKHYDRRIKEMEEYNLSKRAKENLKIYDTNSLILKTEELQQKEQKDYIKELKKRKVSRNIKARNIKQLVKKIILSISIKLYLKVR